jgi:hypothetical protein
MKGLKDMKKRFCFSKDKERDLFMPFMHFMRFRTFFPGIGLRLGATRSHQQTTSQFSKF